LDVCDLFKRFLSFPQPREANAFYMAAPVRASIA